DLVGVDLGGERNGPLEAAEGAFAVVAPTLLLAVLRALLAAQRERIFVKAQLDVLQLDARQFGGDEVGVLGFVHVHARRGPRQRRRARGEAAHFGRSEEVVEQAVHLAAESGEWIARERLKAALRTPGRRVAVWHGGPPSSAGPAITKRAAPRRRRTRR